MSVKRNQFFIYLFVRASTFSGESSILETLLQLCEEDRTFRKFRGIIAESETLIFKIVVDVIVEKVFRKDV